MSLKITNSRVLNFYKANPGQNIDKNNLFLVEMIENIKENFENGINTNETLQYLDNFKTIVDNNFKDLENKVNDNNLSNEIKALDSKIQLLNKDTEQLSEIKNMVSSQKYNLTKEIEAMMKNSENSSIINIGEIIDKKHAAIVNEISTELSKGSRDSNNALSATLNNQLQERFNDIKKETDKIINSDSSNNISVIEGYFTKLNDAFTISETKNESDRKHNIEQQQLVTTSQNELLYEKLNNTIKPSLERIDQYIDIQTTTNSSRKGSNSEMKLETVLNKCFPNSSIENTSGMAHCGDFLVKYKSSSFSFHTDSNSYIPVIVENKCYKDNVKELEVNKFIEDVKATNNHGIFLSQTSGIATKNNFDIEFEGTNVLIYIHNVQYDEHIIVSAFKILEAILSKINLNNSGENIPKEKIQAIRREVQEFIQIKSSLIKDSNDIINIVKKNLIFNIEKLQFPNLSSLVNITTSAPTHEHVCNVCGDTFPTKHSLGSHRKKHTSKTKTNSVIDVNTSS
tara:strand:+ start:307 stop:1842 length:1536 start_codon:yes stop_codon:yes gene_type:complete